MAQTKDQWPGALVTAQAVAAGRVSAEQATRDCLDRIAAQEDDVRAWVAVDGDGAMAAARLCDRAAAGGPLHGVPIGVKDIFAVQGLPWRSGSAIWSERRADFDAGSVALARRAGAVIVGKTETTEFAGYRPSRTRNPRAAGRTPGGSSSGSAAAVACGMVPLALGTQTSGSIIRPASYCGVVGYKPSFDLIETGGVTPLSRSLDTVGVFARSVPDAAFLVEALSGLDLRPKDSDLPRQLPLYRSPAWTSAGADLLLAWANFEARLEDAGRLDEQVFSAQIERSLTQASALHARIMALEASEALAFEYRSAPDLLSPGLRAQLEEGQGMTARQRADDRTALRELRQSFSAETAPDAVWLTPSATGAAPELRHETTGDPAFNRLWSLLGLPCCSVPILQSPEGYPIGVQVVGAMGNDRGVLRVAHALMRHFAPA